MAEDLKAANGKSTRNREEVLASKTCGCFYCQAVFTPDEIEDWCDDQWHPEGATALCPHCGIDSVIGDAAGYELTPDFLAAMLKHWF
ncbi:cytoplasmic protein [Actibacterium lipolyticum]|uniref:Cytoplasmic protein n=1 Tax=Actibacterium lipolyticum TaxID=1524263 RepID=A0A238KPE3_9RHOB|nr:cytoplasmic protein [Actibacterium lipolyticum]SMX44527.1 hypothetical protein COL8621_02573 [Actibacterium lipolyticum]